VKYEQSSNAYQLLNIMVGVNIN